MSKWYEIARLVPFKIFVEDSGVQSLTIKKRGRGCILFATLHDLIANFFFGLEKESSREEI